MATYTDYPNALYLDEFGDLKDHSYYYYTSVTQIAISNFDYTNNYLVLVKSYAGSSSNSYFSFIDTTATRISSDNNTNYANIYVYEVSSSSFTIKANGVSSFYWNYFYIPKTATVRYGTGPSSTGVQNISVPSNIDFTGDVFAILPIYNGGVISGAVQLKYILYGPSVPYNLVKVNDNATTINGNIATNSANCPIAYFQFTSKLNIPEIQTGDVLNYNAGTTATVDLTGCQFSCRLKGSTTSYDSSKYAYGANCYADFDFSSVSDGNITVGSNHGAYIALTNGTGTDINYNRMMVAGDAGGPSYYTSPYGQYALSTGGNAGLFGGSGANGSTDRSANNAKGGTQSAGGAKHPSRTEAAANGGFGRAGDAKSASTGSGSSYYYYYSGAGGNGWYGGGGGNARTDSYNTTSGGGGSSYLLTASSYKPTGYFPEWTTYAPLISNATSELLSGTRDYFATITILDAPASGPYPTSLTLSGQTTSYHVNDTFSFNGTCTANYSDGTSATVTPTSVSTPDMTTAGIKTVTVTYTEGSTTVTATYDITVTTVSLVSITLSGQTTNYYVGDTFTFTGTCTAHYDDTSTLVVNPTSVSSPDMSTTGNKTITVSYTEGGITATATYTITVNAVEPVSISISGQTVTYYQGDTFSIDGTVTATYNNGSTEDVTSQSTASGYDMSYIGQQQVTITWSGLTTTITITVVARTPTSLTAYGVKTSFTRGEPFGFGSGFFIATFNNGASADVTSYVVASGYDMYTVGTYTVTVSYTSNNTTVTTSYTITVSAPTGNVYYNYSEDMVIRDHIVSSIEHYNPVQVGDTYRVTLSIDHTKEKVIVVCTGATCNSAGTLNYPYGCTCDDASSYYELRANNAFNDRKMFTMSKDDPKIFFPTNTCGYVIVPIETTVVTFGSVGASQTTTLNISNYDFDNYYYYLFVDYTATNVSESLVDVTKQLPNTENGYGRSTKAVGGDIWRPMFSLGQQIGGGQKIYRIHPSSTNPQFTMIASKVGGTETSNCYIAGDNYFVIKVPVELYQTPSLKIGDKLVYTANDTVTNLQGFRFSCEMYGTNTISNAVDTYGQVISYGAHCYAEFDFSDRSRYDGIVHINTVDYQGGVYMAIENGDGPDMYYNRIMVAGCAGDRPAVGANAGIFGGSGSAGNSGGTGGTQSSGTWAVDGWYGGTSGSNGSGGGSSYILTADSYKPNGYLSDWSKYSPIISNATSSVRDNNDSVAPCTIEILTTPTDGIRTVRYFTGSVYSKCRANYYTGTEWKLCNIHYYKDRLPQEYQEVEYIQPMSVNSGYPYVNIGVSPTPRTRVVTKVTMPADSAYLFYVSDGAQTTSYGFTALNDISKYRSSFGTSAGILTLESQSDPFILDKNANYTKITLNDGTIVDDTVPDESFTLSGTIYLFAKRYGTTLLAHADNMKVYSFDVYESGTLVRQLVPCYRKSDNKAGFYDMVNGTFYYNGGSGTLVAGPNKLYHD